MEGHPCAYTRAWFETYAPAQARVNDDSWRLFQYKNIAELYLRDLDGALKDPRDPVSGRRLSAKRRDAYYKAEQERRLATPLRDQVTLLDEDELGLADAATLFENRSREILCKFFDISGFFLIGDGKMPMNLFRALELIEENKEAFEYWEASFRESGSLVHIMENKYYEWLKSNGILSDDVIARRAIAQVETFREYLEDWVFEYALRAAGRSFVEFPHERLGAG